MGIMGRKLRYALLTVVPVLAVLVGSASRVLAQTTGGEGAGAQLAAFGLTWQALVATVAYSLVGMILALVGYKLYDLITPFSVTKELEEDQNVSVGIVVGAVILGTSIIVASAIH